MAEACPQAGRAPAAAQGAVQVGEAADLEDQFMPTSNRRARRAATAAAAKHSAAAAAARARGEERLQAARRRAVVARAEAEAAGVHYAESRRALRELVAEVQLELT